MTLRVLTILCVSLLIAACGKRAPLNPDAELCGLTGPKIRVPTFTIRISLSEAAAKRLTDAGETIKGLISFDGDGIPRKDEYTAPNRPIVLGCYQFEITKPGEISITNAYISVEESKRLTDPDYYVGVSIFSGRRAFKDNVLSNGFAEMHISQTATGPVQITCDLLPQFRTQ
jgi:hypothetical protein